MLIKVKDKEGNIYTNDMSDERAIIEIHFCTSYTQVVVQDETINDEGVKIYPIKNIFIPTEKDDLESAIDFLAVSDEEIGSWA